MTGSTILHYKILEKIGEGGMGVVYLAEDTKLGRKVALKFLPQHISADSEVKARFEIEARAAAALNHPNIATIYSIEELGDKMFISMEYIKGVELKDKIFSSPEGMEKEEIIKIAAQIADGLEAAHKEGITHRDIKSGNIMITESGTVKIMDFGLAKVKGGSKVTQMGTTVGTVAYMSPEQTRGDEVDSRADIWSLGVVIYEMLTGKMPFTGDYNQAVIYSILNEEPQPTEKIEEGLEHIIEKALKKDPEERYRSAVEITEELRTISQGGEVKRIKTKGSKLPWIVSGAAVIVIATALYHFMPSSKGIKTTETIKTIAVLPFANISSDPNQEYISDGLSEELISVLQKNPKLRVTARTSSFYFKGKNVDLKTIAGKLSVNNILEGSVQKAGNNLRISADLVNVKTDATLWSNTYDGTMNNIFALQDSISGNVAEALNAALLGKEKERPERKTNPEAYNDYLLGNHFWDLRGKENFRKADGYYEKALSIDSTYAPAWVGLSNIHIHQADMGYVPADEGNLKAIKEIEKALELDPNLADAYAQLGNIKMTYNWDFIGADESYKKALELEPENTSAINGAAHLAFTLGRLKEAIKLERRLIEIDPVHPDGYINLGIFLANADLFDESIAAFRKCLELNPQLPGAHVIIGINYMEKGKLDSALMEIQKDKEPGMQTSALSMVYYALGKKKEADDKLAELIKDFQYGSAYHIAEVYAYMNEKDKAFEWLERAYNQRDATLDYLKGDILMHNIVKDPRYAAFLKKMKLPL